MSNESPARILYDEEGNRVGVATNPIQVTGAVQVHAVGITGPVRVDQVGGTGPFRVDSVGVTGPVSQPTAQALQAQVQGLGAAGSPSGGVVSVQGVSGARPVPVSGTVAVSDFPSVGVNGVTGPVFSTQIAGVDSTGSLQPFRTYDLDLGVTGVNHIPGVHLRISATGGSVEAKGQRTKAQSIPVTFATDQDAVAIYLAAPFGSRTGIVTSSVTLGGGSAGTLNRVYLTAYTEQTSNATRSVASSSANDTSAGTGARKVRITYYNSSLTGPFTTDVTLNGTTAVATSVSDICFVESVIVLESGSGKFNAGVITLYVNSTGGGGAIGAIGFGGIVTGVGDNRTFWGHHYVADGFTATLATFVASAESGGSGTNATFFFRVNNPLSSVSPEVIVSDLLLVTGSIVRVLSYPVTVVGPAKVITYGVPAVNNVKLNASIDFSEVMT